jgi:hypothetical protein
MRKHHETILGADKKADFESSYQIKPVGELEDFSIRHWGRTKQQIKILVSLIKEHNIEVLHIM